jgi:hypothetical protein
MKSRLRERNLFEDHEFLFIGEFSNDSISLTEVIQLAAMNGAVIRGKAKDFTDETGEEGRITRVVLFDENVRRISRRMAEQMLLTGQVHCVNKTWLVDSLACYKLRVMDDYKTYEE